MWSNFVFYNISYLYTITKKFFSNYFILFYIEIIETNQATRLERYNVYTIVKKSII